MTEVEDKITNLQVVKRNGKKVDFNGSKIALAIKKGFDSVNEIDEETGEKLKYTTKDINVVYEGVLKRIEKEFANEEKIKIETIQDMIEEVLQKKGIKMFMKVFLNIVKEEIYRVKCFLMRNNYINF